GTNDIGFSMERRERLGGGNGVIEVKRRGGIIPYKFVQRLEIDHHRLSKGNYFVNADGGTGQQQHHAAGQHHDQRLLVPDGHVLENSHTGLSWIFHSRHPPPPAIWN